MVEETEDLPALEAAAGENYETGWEHVRYEYGTSGFRMLADEMDAAAFRCGLFAAYYSGHVCGGQIVGAVLTASHNPVNDNGIKLVAPDGNLLDERVEAVLDAAVRLQTAEEIISHLDEHLLPLRSELGAPLGVECDAGTQSSSHESPEAASRRASTADEFNGRCESESESEIVEDRRPDGPKAKMARIDHQEAADGSSSDKASLTRTPRVALGRDTRPSGRRLGEAYRKGALRYCASTVIHDFGVVTTPEMHFFTRLANKTPHMAADAELLHQAYARHLTDCFSRVLQIQAHRSGRDPIKRSIILDAANGVGALAAARLDSKLRESGLPLSIHVINDGGSPNDLNHMCGSDFVKNQLTHPEGLLDSEAYKGLLRPGGTTTYDSADGEEGVHFVSVDGDADRVIFFEPRQPFVLLDGDRIAVLAAMVIKRLLKEAGMSDFVDLAVVQTAYANGASSTLLRDRLGITPIFTDTGVKHLHAEALKHDVSVYFEANGHGTLLASTRTRQMLVGKGSTPPHDNKCNKQMHDTKESTPPHDNEENTQMHDNQETIQMLDGKGNAQMHDNEENTPPHDNDETRKMHVNKGNAQMHDNEQNTQMHDNKGNAQMHDNQETRQTHDNEETRKMHVNEEIRQTHDTEGTRQKLGSEGLLLALLDLANPLVGDALADMLLVIALLEIAGLQTSDWTALYQDLPSCLLKVEVKDRSAFATADAGRIATKPEGLQASINAAIQAASQGSRAFVRPSGTENCLRVFAESPNQHEADKLALAVVEIVKRFQ